MLARYTIAGLAASALLASVAFAQSPTATGESTKMAPPASASDTSSSFQGTWRAAKVAGLSVYNDKNESVGSINDLLMDKSGNIKAVVIGVGGFLGVGEKDVIVPFEAVKGSNKDNKWTLVMSATKDELKAAQGFKYDRTKMTWMKDQASSTTGAR
jgi:sporulation protein YlmC with PRC-barrel domain